MPTSNYYPYTIFDIRPKEDNPSYVNADTHYFISSAKTTTLKKVACEIGRKGRQPKLYEYIEAHGGASQWRLYNLESSTKDDLKVNKQNLINIHKPILNSRDAIPQKDKLLEKKRARSKVKTTCDLCGTKIATGAKTAHQRTNKCRNLAKIKKLKEEALQKEADELFDEEPLQKEADELSNEELFQRERRARIVMRMFAKCGIQIA